MTRALLLVLTAAALVGCGDGGADTDTGPAVTATPRSAATATPSPTTDPAATSGPERAAVAATLRRYAAAVRAGDARTICRDLLAREVRTRVEAAGGSCRDLVAPRIDEGGPQYGIAIRSISVSGDRALARITASERDGARDSRQALVREGGDWRLSVG